MRSRFRASLKRILEVLDENSESCFLIGGLVPVDDTLCGEFVEERLCCRKLLHCVVLLFGGQYSLNRGSHHRFVMLIALP